MRLIRVKNHIAIMKHQEILPSDNLGKNHLNQAEMIAKITVVLKTSPSE
jgi:hypothetical protein